MKKSTVSSVIVAVIAASGVLAAAPAAPTLATVKAGTYKVESYHTQVGFSLSHLDRKSVV